jgi:hypothetical protein
LQSRGKTLYPNINENSDAYREWGKLGMEYYKYFYEEKNKFKKENLVAIPYVDLIKDPKDTVLKIYNQLQLDITPTFLNKLESETQKARKYSSKHSYSLEQYGFDKDEIYNELNFIFKDLNIGR